VKTYELSFNKQLVQKYFSVKPSKREFANANKIPPSTFQKWYELYEKGTLDNLNTFTETLKRLKQSQYGIVEEHLVNYIKTRRTLFTQDKLGLSWAVLQDKALTTFSASHGWISDVL
jgi:hypothetical protein